MSLKEESEKKHQCLQSAYEQLYVDYNQAQDKVVQLEGKLTETAARTRPEILSCSVQTDTSGVVDKHAQTNDTEAAAEEKNEGNNVDELTDRVKDILKGTAVETKANETIVEAVAKQYVDAKWKKDVLEKRVTELTRDLNGAVEMKENLQVECDVMQSHIDSLLIEIQDLKLNLPSIPEASEERVASLETETETLHEEVKRLEAENSALRKENGALRDEDLSETRSENRGTLGVAGRCRKPTRLEDIPEDIEDVDGSPESFSRRFRTVLDENEDLRKKIDLLENSQREMQEQLTMSLEKCKGLDENIEFIEELKLDLENVKLKLKTSTSNTKQLENSLAAARNENNEVQKENEELCQRNEQLEDEISKWLERYSEAEGNDALRNLQEQLNKITREKNDLEYDLLNMRKGLDEAIDQIDAKEIYIAKLSQENDGLTKEKGSLMEQLTAIQDESNDKIDLVSTEKSLLEQEQTELKEKVTSNERELNEILERLRETEERYGNLEREFLGASERTEELRSENESLKNEIRKHEESRDELELDRLTERLSSMQNDHAQLSNEVETLRLRERELAQVRENLSEVS